MLYEIFLRVVATVIAMLIVMAVVAYFIQIKVMRDPNGCKCGGGCGCKSKSNTGFDGGFPVSNAVFTGSMPSGNHGLIRF
ncbi:MAG: hypothetical protein KIS94_05590 [Chitinophagales bacterium]|nr:hypothetical protein [Chitinophagales bacterium]